MCLTTVIAEISSCSRIDMSYTPYTCVVSRLEQKHWTVNLGHKVPCKLALFCSRHTHTHCSPWLRVETSLYFSCHISHMSGTGTPGILYAYVPISHGQTQMVVNLTDMFRESIIRMFERDRCRSRSTSTFSWINRMCERWFDLDCWIANFDF